nr:translation initiation factor IF-2-like [Chlorocebus sabaeus]
MGAGGLSSSLSPLLHSRLRALGAAGSARRPARDGAGRRVSLGRVAGRGGRSGPAGQAAPPSPAPPRPGSGARGAETERASAPGPRLWDRHREGGGRRGLSARTQRPFLSAAGEEVKKRPRRQARGGRERRTRVQLPGVAEPPSSFAWRGGTAGVGESGLPRRTPTVAAGSHRGGGRGTGLLGTCCTLASAPRPLPPPRRGAGPRPEPPPPPPHRECP